MERFDLCASFFVLQPVKFFSRQNGKTLFHKNLDRFIRLIESKYYYCVFTAPFDEGVSVFDIDTPPRNGLHDAVKPARPVGYLNGDY